MINYRNSRICILKHAMFLFSFIITLNCLSQNLVSNPGFEYFHCRNWNISSIEMCDSWTTPSLQTPDYFNNACSEYKSEKFPDLHWWGPQYPRTGNCYMGIIGYRPNRGDPTTTMCEYIQGKLIQPLDQGVRYTVTINISLSESSTMSLNNMGVFFSEKEIKEKTLQPLKYEPQVTLKSGGADTSAWVTISSTYTAKGNEEYFTIGCFNNGKKIKYSKTTPAKEIRGPRNEAYYFIDDISVVAEGTEDYEVKPQIIEPVVIVHKNTDTSVKETTTPLVPSIGVPVILKNIFFETGKFDLLPQSFDELHKLYMMLKTNPEINIVINGYTDNVGNEKDNETLSLNRAKAVYDFLTKKEIEVSRLSYVGYGDKNPIATNTTEAGREQNRRVEFILSKKGKDH